MELVMAVLQGWHGSVEADHPAATALAKILRVLPAATAAAAEAMRGVQAQNPGDKAAMPDAELTVTITQACQNRKRIRVTYRTGSRMLLEPWAVVVRHGRWYLLGWLPDADARRVLRLDRITVVETTDGACTPPDDLDPVSQVEDHLADGWTFPVEVRIDAPLGKVAPCIPRTLGRLVATGEHSCTLRGSTDNPTWYAEQLAAIPAPFTVLTGEKVHAAVQAVAQRFTHASGAAISKDPPRTTRVSRRPRSAAATPTGMPARGLDST